jgi:hypothetical protein
MKSSVGDSRRTATALSTAPRLPHPHSAPPAPEIVAVLASQCILPSRRPIIVASRPSQPSFW